MAEGHGARGRLYRATNSFPAAERFNLTSQIRRAAASIPSNLAEGAARRKTKAFIGFAQVARGSLAELETHIELASRVGLPISFANWRPRLTEVGRPLNALIRSLKHKVRDGSHLT